MKLGVYLALACGLTVLRAPAALPAENRDPLFSAVQRLRIGLPPEGVETLQQYQQVWRQKRPERIDARATVREGVAVYTNVAIHLKGSFSFQPFDSKPSLTLNFDKFAPGQRFHGLSKIHLNNSIQDDSYLCEQLARELFQDLGVPSPRAGHALVEINGRNLGMFVLIEGANKQFLKRHFASVAGNLYDGGSGGEITSKLKVDSGDDPEDRSDLKKLAEATREPDPSRRLERLQQLLNVDQFINFAATEAFLVHWDGYSVGGNNYRLFHDVRHDKMIFIPHGMDQLFGVSRSLSMSITPPFKGLVAKALFSVPEARQRYLQRMAQLMTNEFRAEAIYARIDRLAEQMRPALSPSQVSELEQAWSNLKARVAQRYVSVAQQLQNPRRPLNLAEGQSVRLSGWSFKTGLTPGASGNRRIEQNREILSVSTRAKEGSGSWRTTVLLDAGHYALTGRAYTEGLTASDAKGTNGVIIRASGERSTKGIAISEEWRDLIYEFDVRGIEDVELVCEFRGPRGSGFFDAPSIRLARQGPPAAFNKTKAGAP